MWSEEKWNVPWRLPTVVSSVSLVRTITLLFPSEKKKGKKLIKCKEKAAFSDQSRKTLSEMPALDFDKVEPIEP